MNLAEKVNNLINADNEIALGKFTEITEDFVFEKSKKDIVECVLSNLDYPNLNALKAAYSIPDNQYEEKLLSYESEDMTDDQAVYWMLALGEIKSDKSFEKIKPYTNTSLFNQAFIAMGKIDINKTMSVFEDFLDSHCHLYTEENETYKHDSGFYTMVMLLKSYDSAEEIIKDYDTSKNSMKKKLVDDALTFC